jgi:hypothetical protein
MAFEETAAAIPLDPGVAETLIGSRDALVRRWLALLVERSSFDELTARPLAERVGELDLLWEAAGEPIPDPAVDETEAMEDEPEPDEGPAAPVTPLFPSE